MYWNLEPLLTDLYAYYVQLCPPVQVHICALEALVWFVHRYTAQSKHFQRNDGDMAYNTRSSCMGSRNNDINPTWMLFIQDLDVLFPIRRPCLLGHRKSLASLPCHDLNGSTLPHKGAK